MSLVWVKQHQPRFVCSERSQHRLQTSIQQRGIHNSNSQEKKTKACKYVTRKVEVHKYLQIHDCIITTAPDIIHDTNLRCKSCYLSKLCATKDLTTQIGFCPCLATNALKKWIEVCLWKPTYVQLSTRGRLHRTNLGWKKLWLNTCWLLHFFQWNPFEVEELGAWATQWTSPPQLASLLFFLKLSSEKTRPTTKWESE